MLRTLTLSAATGLALLTAAVSGPAIAADPDYGYDDNRASRHRPVAKDYDENSYGRGRHDRQWNYRYSRRVEASASYAGDYAPYYVREWRAKRSAIEAWKAKVSRIYGEPFAHWRAASDKDVSCEGAAGTIYCTASARPERGWQRWGWWNEGRGRY